MATPSKRRLEGAFATTPSTPDALASVDASVKQRILEKCDEAMASALIQNAAAKQRAVLARLKQREGAATMTPDEAKALEEHVFREALGRLLISELELPRSPSPARSSSPSPPASDFTPASPFALGARFNQLGESCVTEFMRQLCAVQRGVFDKPLAWAELLAKDAARADRVGELKEHVMQVSVSDASVRYPALHAVAERLSCLPRELNFKTSTSIFGEVTGPIILYAAGSVVVRVSPRQALFGYCFATKSLAALANGWLTGSSSKVPISTDCIFLCGGNRSENVKWTLQGEGHFLVAMTCDCLPSWGLGPE